jgi:hypothetical protein
MPICLPRCISNAGWHSGSKLLASSQLSQQSSSAPVSSHSWAALVTMATAPCHASCTNLHGQAFCWPAAPGPSSNSSSSSSKSSKPSASRAPVNSLLALGPRLP